MPAAALAEGHLHCRALMPSEQLTATGLAAAQEALGLSLSGPALLSLALTHRSFVNENPGLGAQSNERLEFLGDGIINFVIGHRLYELSPHASEGELTAQRAQVVRGETLALAAMKLGLGGLLVMGRGEASSGGAERASNLANAFEAVAGAVFLDCGFEAARSFILRALGEEVAAAARSGTPKDPKSVLQEVLQARGMKSPEYALAAVIGPDHDRLFVIDVLVDGQPAGRGEGRRKVDAERAAAQDAAKRLEAEAVGERDNLALPDNFNPHPDPLPGRERDDSEPPPYQGEG